MTTHPKPPLLARQGTNAVRLAACAVLLTLCGALIVSSWARTTPAQDDANRRELDKQVPAHIPIKIEVRNLDKENFMHELEVEVTNTGEKPIYFLALRLELPELKSPRGVMIGYFLRYGSSELHEFENRPKPEDEAIQPGKSYVFKLPENWAGGYDLAKTQWGWSTPKKVSLVFSRLHYGDGTGFLGKSGAAIPSSARPRSTK